MLQVRQLSLETSHPYLPFCRHIIPTLHFIFLENVLGFISVFLFFVNKVIPMQLSIKGVWPVQN